MTSNEWLPVNYGSDKQDNEMDNASCSNNISLHIRLGFIRKVYGVLSAQLFLTMLLCFISMTTPSFQKFQVDHPTLMYIAAGCSIILVLALSCFKSLARTVPTNYILLAIFTLCEAYLVSLLCGIVEPKLVFMAAAMTCAITFALTYYACTTKKDFTIYNSALFIAATCLLLFSLFAMFTRNNIVHILISSCGVFLYSMYLIYDTQVIMGNKQYELDVEDYIYGAMMLYLDVINIFIYILDILQRLQKN
jgi:FtsH-binding integral membrane protein